MTDLYAYQSDPLLAYQRDPLLERACHYAELLGGIRGWLDLNQEDPRFFSAEKTLNGIRDLVDQVDAEPAEKTGGERR